MSKCNISLALAICFISILVKLFMYGMNIKLVATELLIIIITSLYSVIRTVYLGIYSDEVEMHDSTNKMSICTNITLTGVIAGICLAIFFGLKSAILYGTSIRIKIWYFVISFIASIMMYIPFFVLIVVLQHSAYNKISKKQSSKKIE